MTQVPFQEELTPRARRDEYGEVLRSAFGTSFLNPERDRLFERGEQLLLATNDVAEFHMPVRDYSLGLPFAIRLEDRRLRLSHELATLRGNAATRNICEIGEEQLALLLDGKDTTCDPSLRGDCILRYRDVAIGVGLARDGWLKNRLPRWLVAKS